MMWAMLGIVAYAVGVAYLATLPLVHAVSSLP